MKPIQQRAAAYAAMFETARRPDGSEFVRRKPEAPPGLQELCLEPGRLDL